MFLAINKSPKDPLKYLLSVKTEIPLTPALLYPSITWLIEMESFIIDLEGDFLLCSAIIP